MTYRHIDICCISDEDDICQRPVPRAWLVLSAVQKASAHLMVHIKNLFTYDVDLAI